MNDAGRATVDALQHALTLRRLPGRYAFCRLSPERAIPDWAINAAGAAAGAAGGAIISITRTDDELSIIAPEGSISIPDVKDGLAIEPGWAAMRLVGKLDFALVGVLATLTRALADAGIPVCAISTFDTDVLLIKDEHEQRAIEALSKVARFVDETLESGRT